METEDLKEVTPSTYQGHGVIGEIIYVCLMEKQEFYDQIQCTTRKKINSTN